MTPERRHSYSTLLSGWHARGISRVADLGCPQRCCEPRRSSLRQRGRVASEAAKVEADLKDAGLEAEADEMHKLRYVLDEGDATGSELEKSAADAHALAKKLKEKEDFAMAAEVEELAKHLDAAAKAKLEAEVKEKEKEAADDLKEAAKEGHALAEELKAEGLGEDAVEVERIAKHVEEMASRLSASDFQDVMTTVHVAKP